MFVESGSILKYDDIPYLVIDHKEWRGLHGYKVLGKEGSFSYMFCSSHNVFVERTIYSWDNLIYCIELENERSIKNGKI